MNCLNWILCDPFGATAQLAKLFQSVSLAVFAQIASRQRSFTARGACHGLHRLPHSGGYLKFGVETSIYFHQLSRAITSLVRAI